MSNSAIKIQTQPIQQSSAPIQFTFGTDAVLASAALLWLLWDRALRPTVTSKLEGVFTPIEEERKLSSLLAQIGVITSSTRVVLCAFHNGALDNAGYHLQKLTTINTYTAPGKEPMAHAIRDLPIGRIMIELEAMIKTTGWVTTEYDDSLPEACKTHLKTNSIYRMHNRLIRVGNLPIGILSLQYDSKEEHQFPVDSELYSRLLDDLYDQIALIMKRRIVHPSPLKKLILMVKALTSTGS